MSEFYTDMDALVVLNKYGLREKENGIIRGRWKELPRIAKDAILYLCDDWDFVFLEDDDEERSSG